jgi:hypothetical protein
MPTTNDLITNLIKAHGGTPTGSTFAELQASLATAIGNVAPGAASQVKVTAASGAAFTLDAPTLHAVEDITLTASCTITMPTPVVGLAKTVRLRTGAGAFTATFTGVKWPGGTPPTITVTAAREDIFAFQSDGVDWYGTIVGQNFTP